MIKNNIELQEAIEECCERVGNCLIQNKNLKFKTSFTVIKASRARVWNLNNTVKCKDAWKKIKMTCENEYCLNINHMQLRTKKEIVIELKRLKKVQADELIKKAAKEKQDRIEREFRGIELCHRCKKEVYREEFKDRDGFPGFCSTECIMKIIKSTTPFYAESNCLFNPGLNRQWYLIGVAKPLNLLDAAAITAGFKSYKDCICEYGTTNCLNSSHLIERTSFINFYTELLPEQAKRFRWAYIEHLRKELIELTFKDNQEKANKIIKAINLAEAFTKKEIINN